MSAHPSSILEGGGWFSDLFKKKSPAPELPQVEMAAPSPKDLYLRFIPYDVQLGDQSVFLAHIKATDDDLATYVQYVHALYSNNNDFLPYIHTLNTAVLINDFLTFTYSLSGRPVILTQEKRNEFEHDSKTISLNDNNDTINDTISATRDSLVNLMNMPIATQRGPPITSYDVLRELIANQNTLDETSVTNLKKRILNLFLNAIQSNSFKYLIIVKQFHLLKALILRSVDLALHPELPPELPLDEVLNKYETLFPGDQEVHLINYIHAALNILEIQIDINTILGSANNTDTPLRDKIKSVVNTAYRKLSLKSHPNKGGDRKVFDRISKAKEFILYILENNLFPYEVLINHVPDTAPEPRQNAVQVPRQGEELPLYGAVPRQGEASPLHGTVPPGISGTGLNLGVPEPPVRATPRIGEAAPTVGLLENVVENNNAASITSNFTPEELEVLGNNLDITLDENTPPTHGIMRPTRPPPLPPQLPARGPTNENLARQEQFNRIIANIEARNATRRLAQNTADVPTPSSLPPPATPLQAPYKLPGPYDNMPNLENEPNESESNPLQLPGFVAPQWRHFNTSGINFGRPSAQELRESQPTTIPEPSTGLPPIRGATQEPVGQKIPLEPRINMGQLGRMAQPINPYRTTPFNNHLEGLAEVNNESNGENNNNNDPFANGIREIAASHPSRSPTTIPVPSRANINNPFTNPFAAASRATVATPSGPQIIATGEQLETLGRSVPATAEPSPWNQAGSTIQSSVGRTRANTPNGPENVEVEFPAPLSGAPTSYSGPAIPPPVDSSRITGLTPEILERQLRESTLPYPTRSLKRNLGSISGVEQGNEEMLANATSGTPYSPNYNVQGSVQRPHRLNNNVGVIPTPAPGSPATPQAPVNLGNVVAAINSMSTPPQVPGAPPPPPPPEVPQVPVVAPSPANISNLVATLGAMGTPPPAPGTPLPPPSPSGPVTTPMPPVPPGVENLVAVLSALGTPTPVAPAEVPTAAPQERPLPNFRKLMNTLQPRKKPTAAPALSAAAPTPTTAAPLIAPESSFVGTPNIGANYLSAEEGELANLIGRYIELRSTGSTELAAEIAKLKAELKDIGSRPQSEQETEQVRARREELQARIEQYDRQLEAYKRDLAEIDAKGMAALLQARRDTLQAENELLEAGDYIDIFGDVYHSRVIHPVDTNYDHTVPTLGSMNQFFANYRMTLYKPEKIQRIMTAVSKYFSHNSPAFNTLALDCPTEDLRIIMPLLKNRLATLETQILRATFPAAPLTAPIITPNAHHFKEIYDKIKDFMTSTDRACPGKVPRLVTRAEAVELYLDHVFDKSLFVVTEAYLREVFNKLFPLEAKAQANLAAAQAQLDERDALAKKLQAEVDALKAKSEEYKASIETLTSATELNSADKQAQLAKLQTEQEDLVRTIIDLDGQLRAAEAREEAVRGVLENDNVSSVNSLEIAGVAQEGLVEALDRQIRDLQNAGEAQNIEMAGLREQLARANQQLELLRAAQATGQPATPVGPPK